MPRVQTAAVETLKCMPMWASSKIMGPANGFSLEYEREINDAQGF